MHAPIPHPNSLSVQGITSSPTFTVAPCVKPLKLTPPMSITSSPSPLLFFVTCSSYSWTGRSTSSKLVGTWIGTEASGGRPRARPDNGATLSESNLGLVNAVSESCGTKFLN
ncbi:hypothetical protein V6N11_067708 [Hibiscus sabdariffa]|uniref:Uncharacterized protein n=1 Tax=Hibiscus sabdariffa TaxID=183260 RepID=A0ABR2SRY4_9ROSI